MTKTVCRCGTFPPLLWLLCTHKLCVPRSRVGKECWVLCLLGISLHSLQVWPHGGGLPYLSLSLGEGEGFAETFKRTWVLV